MREGESERVRESKQGYTKKRRARSATSTNGVVLTFQPHLCEDLLDSRSKRSEQWNRVEAAGGLRVDCWLVRLLQAMPAVRINLVSKVGNRNMASLLELPTQSVSRAHALQASQHQRLEILRSEGHQFRFAVDRLHREY